MSYYRQRRGAVQFFEKHVDPGLDDEKRHFAYRLAEAEGWAWWDNYRFQWMPNLSGPKITWDCFMYDDKNKPVQSLGDVTLKDVERNGFVNNGADPYARVVEAELAMAQMREVECEALRQVDAARELVRQRQANRLREAAQATSVANDGHQEPTP